MFSRITSRRNVPSTRVASTAPVPGASTGHGVRRGSRASAAAAAACRRWRAGWRSSAGRRPGAGRGRRAPGRRRRRTAPRAGSCAATPRAPSRWPSSSRAFLNGTWCARQVPSTCRPSTTSGPVQPFGEASTIIGQRGRSTIAVHPGPALDLGDLVEAAVERGGELLVHRRRVVALDQVGRVAVAAQQVEQLLARDAGQHGRVGDLVAVEVQDRQHGAVGARVEELVRVPARRPAARSRPRRRRRRRPRRGRGCRRPPRRRATSE